jgi:LmbE family N-acetylglucosaminyl deacetylase
LSEQHRLLSLPEDWESALAVEAHPDDLEYGVSGAVARWTAMGKQVAYVLATRGEAGIDSMDPEEAGPLREEEERRSARVVGVDTVEFLDHRDGVVEYGLPLRRDIARAIRRHRPDVVITGSYHLKWTTGALNMADHRAVGVAVLDAARDAGNRWIFPELLDEGLEPWSGVGMVFVGGSPYPTHAVDVTDYIEKAVESLEEHRVYIDNLGKDFDPDMYLRMNANAVGELFGCDYAVSFEVVGI